MTTFPTTSPGATRVSTSDTTRTAFTASTNNQVVSRKLSFASPPAAVATFSTSSQDGQPRGLAFKPDGTAMYVVGLANDSIYQYSLSTAWDITTASFVASKSVSAESTAPLTIDFKSDGTSFIIASNVPSNAQVLTYSLSTAWDITTATNTAGTSFTTDFASGIAGAHFSSDGMKLYLNNVAGTDIRTYTLSTSRDPASSTSSTSRSINVEDMTSFGGSSDFSSDGLEFFQCSNSSPGAIYKWSLSSAWDLSTATHVATAKTTSTGLVPQHVFVQGDRLFVIESAQVTEYRNTGGTPPDFNNMDTFSWKVEYLQVGWADDTLGLDIRVMSGATVLAADDAGGTYAVVSNAVTSTTDVVTGPTAFAYVNTSATRAQWALAQVDLRQRWTINMSNDSCHVEVDFVEFTGTYTVTASPRLPDRPRTGVATATCRASIF